MEEGFCMMKKTTNIVSCLLSIIFLLFLNNIGNFKSFVFHYSNLSFSFFNISFIISTLLIISIFALYGSGRIYKKNFLYVFLIIIFYNIISNMFSHFNAFGFLLIYLFLMISTYATQLVIKKKFEFSIVAFTSILLLCLFLFGILNILMCAKYFIGLLFICSIFVIFKNKDKKIEFVNSGSIIFSILFVVAVLGGVGRYVHIWDEFSHWAFDAKVTIDNAKLTLYTGMNYSTNSVPPLLTLWHYFISLFNGGFNEPNLYIGLSIFIFIYMMPMFLYIDKKKIGFLTIVLYVIVSYGFNFLFDGAYSYSILYADLAMGFLGTAAFLLYFYCKSEKIDDRFILSIVLTCIGIIKLSGFVLSFTILLFIYLIDFLDVENKKLNIVRFIKKYCVSIICIAVIVLIWCICLRISSNLNDYNFRLLPVSLQSSISLKLNKDFLLKFFTAIVNSFDDGIIFGFIRISLFPFLIIVFTSICCINKKVFKDNYIKYNISFIVSYVVFFILTALSLFVMFSVYEAGELKSFGRYLNCYHLVMVNYVLFMFTYLIIKNSKYKNCLIITLLLVIMFIPFSKLSSFVTDYSVRYKTEQLSNSRKNNFIEINSKTPLNSKVYVINQQDIEDMMMMWYARYYCYPRKINAHNGAINWKILTKSNEWDLQDWGLTFKTLKKHLREYSFEYLYLFSITDEFIDGMSHEFNIDSELLKKNRLFKISIINNDVYLQSVFEEGRKIDLAN